MSSPIRALCTLFAVTLFVAGCGGGPNPASTTAASTSHGVFLAAIDEVCARAVAANASHPFPLANFDPEHPHSDQLPIVGDYFARFGDLSQTKAELYKLEPPQADAAAWYTLLETADLITANAQHQVAAARAKDVTTFVQTAHTATRLAAQINTAGTRFGFTSESACGKVFG